MSSRILKMPIISGLIKAHFRKKARSFYETVRKWSKAR